MPTTSSSANTFAPRVGAAEFPGIIDGIDAKDIDANMALFQDEAIWRQRPQPVYFPDGHGASVLLSRWSNLEDGRTLEVTSDDQYDDHVLTLRLRRLRGELQIGGRVVWSGSSAPGQLFMAGPKQNKWSAVIYGKYDHLRVFLPQALLAECYYDIFGHPPYGPICLFETACVDDGALAQIAGTFRAVYDHVDSVALGLIDALGIAFASRLISVHYQAPAPGRKRLLSSSNAGIKMLFDYIESHLGVQLYLSQLSEIAGISRFQLSRQFREATGMTPYGYILHRRIARAKELLRLPATGIASIALDVGFSSQAHFTEAFRKEVGVPPGEWRKASS